MSKKLNIKVKIDLLVDSEDSNVKAYASVNIADAFAVHGLSVMDSSKGLFVRMPFTSYKDKNGEKKYSDNFHAITADARTQLNEAVLEAYNQKLEQESEQTDEIEDGLAQSMWLKGEIINEKVN